MAFTRAALRDIYRRRADRYDLSSNMYYLLGLRIRALRRRAVAALDLTPGDSVVELGCGTGLNFPLLEAAVGPTGTVIGVDMSPEMLEVAQRRVERSAWRNVTLIEKDIGAFEYPLAPDAILSTFALTLVPEFDRVIHEGAVALGIGGAFVILDLKRPNDRPEWFVQAMARLSEPFGVTIDLAERRPWESLASHFEDVSLESYWLDCVYVARGHSSSRVATQIANPLQRRRLEEDPD